MINFNPFRRLFSSKLQELKNELLVKKFPIVRLIDGKSGKLLEAQKSDTILLIKPNNSDLIIADARQEPPIVRFQTHSESYKLSQQREEAAKNARLANKFKEMHISTVTGDHDLALKLGKVEEWIRKGWRVKIVIEEKRQKRQITKPIDEKKQLMQEVMGKLRNFADIVGTPETERGCLIFTLYGNQKIISQIKQERNK